MAYPPVTNVESGHPIPEADFYPLTFRRFPAASLAREIYRWKKLHMVGSTPKTVARKPLRVKNAIYEKLLFAPSVLLTSRPHSKHLLHSPPAPWFVKSGAQSHFSLTC